MRAQRDILTGGLALLAACAALTPPAAGGEIHSLVEDGQVEQAKGLLARDSALVAAEDDYQQTPLHVAAHRDHAELVRFLLENGADVDARAYNRFTPLHLAGNPEIVRLLLAKGADVEAEDSSGQTALERAAADVAHTSRFGDEHSRRPREVVRLLREAGAVYGVRSAVYLRDEARVAELLREEPARARQVELLRLAASVGDPKILKPLLDGGADPTATDRWGLPMLYHAISYAEAVETLIAAGADPNVRFTYLGDGQGPPDGSSLLHTAAERGAVRSAEVLLKHEVDPDAWTESGWTPLHSAALAGDADMVRLLLRAGADPQIKVRETTAMALAAANIRPELDKPEENDRAREIVELLHGRGIPIDLYTAVSLGDTERVTELLMTDAKLANTGEGKEPILHRAVDLDRGDIVRRLLAAGARVDAPEQFGGTALHAAAFWGRGEIAGLLIEHGADVHARTEGGDTPLHEAARLNRPGVARILLDAGADVNARDDEGKTPLDWAHLYGKPPRGLVELLREHGAERGRR